MNRIWNLRIASAGPDPVVEPNGKDMIFFASDGHNVSMCVLYGKSCLHSFKRVSFLHFSEKLLQFLTLTFPNFAFHLS